jgi:hypothetical protein
MPFDRWAEPLHRRRINIIDQQDRVRVSQRNGGYFDRLTGDIQLIDVRLILGIKRQCARLEPRRAHIDHDLPVVLDFELNQTTARFHHKPSLVGQSLVVQKLCKASRTVAALFSFTAISVEDSHRKICTVPAGLGHNQLIATNAPVAIGQMLNMITAQMKRPTHAVEQNKIVAERMHLGKREHVGRLGGFPQSNRAQKL